MVIRGGGHCTNSAANFQSNLLFSGGGDFRHYQLKLTTIIGKSMTMTTGMTTMTTKTTMTTMTNLTMATMTTTTTMHHGDDDDDDDENGDDYGGN